MIFSRNALAVMLGGGAGAVCRVMTGFAVMEKLPSGFPLAGIYLAAGPDFYFDFEKKTGIDKKKAEVGINVGAGLKLLNHLQVGANYNIPLGDTADIDGGGSYKTKTWQVSVAYIF